MTSILSELLETLYCGVNPLLTAQMRHLDRNYPHTNIRPALVDKILEKFHPTFWLELGSFVGGSAIVAANCAKKAQMATQIVCMDPFCGDVNMWAWEKATPVAGSDGRPYKFVGLENGRPTVYDRFLANIFFAGHMDKVLPVPCTAIVGLKLVQRLVDEGRLSGKPTVIYLDSAHELNETFIELDLAWKLLPSGGVLFGDDWGWAAVRHDVKRFARDVEVGRATLQDMVEAMPGSEIDGGIFLFEGQWALFK